MMILSISAFSQFNLTGNLLFTNNLLKTPFHYSNFSCLGFLPHNTFAASFIHSNSFSSHDSKSVYQKVSNLDDALNLFDQMSQRRPFPSIIKFNQLLQSVTKMKHFSHSLHLFKQMCALRVPVSDYTLSIAIKCCCQLYRTNDGFAVLGLCFRRSIVPDIFIFSALLDGLILEDRIFEAEIFFKKLIKDKLCEPNVVMYSTMIKGLYKVGNNVIAIQLLRLMDEKGCKPDVVTYNNIIDSLCKDRMIDDAFKLFKEMVFQKGIPPNVINEAMLLFQEMNEKGLKPNVVTYSTMIQGLFSVGRCGDARKLFDEMHGKGQMPDQLTYGIILEGLCDNHQIEEALSLFHLIGDSKLNTDIVVYTILINGASKCGKFDIARLIFQGLTDKGLCPNVRTYNVMISGLCREGLVGDAKELFLKMEDSGCPPDNVTYNVLLQGYLKNKHNDDVDMLLHEMDGRCYALDATTLAFLLNQITTGLLNNTLLELISKLVPKELMDGPSFTAGVLENTKM